MANEEEMTPLEEVGTEKILVHPVTQEDVPDGEKFTAEDARKHMIKVQGGKLYLPVAPRVRWFRSDHPDWSIQTTLLHLDQEFEFAVVQSTICDENNRILAQGIKTQRGPKAGKFEGFGDYVEKAESGSIGRALALLGYGTLTEDLEEGSIVDSPVNAGGYQKKSYDKPSATTEETFTCECGNPIPAGRAKIYQKTGRALICATCETKKSG